MSNVIDIGLERIKRQRRVTTGSRVDQVLRRAREIKAIRVGDKVHATDGRAGTVIGFVSYQTIDAPEREAAMVNIAGDYHCIACDDLRPARERTP